MGRITGGASGVFGVRESAVWVHEWGQTANLRNYGKALAIAGSLMIIRENVLRDSMDKFLP